MGRDLMTFSLFTTWHSSNNFCLLKIVFSIKYFMISISAFDVPLSETYSLKGFHVLVQIFTEIRIIHDLFGLVQQIFGLLFVTLAFVSFR